MHCNHIENQDSCIEIVPIFQGFNNEETIKLQQLISQDHFVKGEVIFIEGESSERLYIVESGLIKLSKVSADGKEQIIRLLFPGDTFGQSALQENGRHYANAEALQPSTICSIWNQDFFETMERNQNMSLRLITALNQRLSQADEWISILSLMEVEQRLARAILFFYEKIQPNNGRLKLPIRKRELASLIGTTPETLSRKFVVLLSENLIEMNANKEIIILNDKKLRELAALN